MAETKRRRRTASPFTKLLNALMSEKGLGVREASRIAGVSPSTITDWRSGALPDDFSAARRLATSLGVTLSFLLTGEDDARPEGNPSVSEVFEDGGAIFDGYAKITIQRLLPRK
jgi:transcriptional regulator with XRE-family HTH domain